MNVLIVTQDEPFYLSRFFLRFLDNIPPEIKIKGIVLLKPFNETILKTAKRTYSLYGPLLYIYFGIKFFILKFLNVINIYLNIGQPVSIRGLAKRKNIPIFEPKNINSSKFLRYVRTQIIPDLICSVAASQIFKKEILNLPKYGCINIHSGHLPRYRGMFPCFWVLYNKEKETAVTVHYMNENLDDGDIILQKKIKIDDGESLDSLIKKTKFVGAKVLIKAINLIGKEKVQPIKNERSKATYFSFPKRKDVIKFKKQGGKII
ncbi:MAG: methionyl-tRNA formyltransferase [Promethearchaeota archaeon]